MWVGRNGQEQQQQQLPVAAALGVFPGPVPGDIRLYDVGWQGDECDRIALEAIRSVIFNASQML